MFCYNVLMSTLKSNITAKRMAILGAKSELVFHLSDLATLWDIRNPNTLRVLLNRYAKSGVLHRLRRGLYSLPEPSTLDPILLGAKALHRYCYLSTETVLYKEGYLSQHNQVYTFVSEVSQHFQLLSQSYLSRQLKPAFLFNSAGVGLVNGVKVASVERAIADLLYFNPLFHLDRTPDWEKVRQVQQQIGYPLTPQRYGSSSP